MKLVVAHFYALRSYVSREFYLVIQELITRYGWKQIETWKLWQAPGTIGDALREEFGELPETILFWEGYELLQARAREIQRLNCARFIMADDLHWWDAAMRQRKMVGFALCDVVLATCAYAWNDFYPEFRHTKPLVWIPHSAGLDFAVPYNHHADNAILLSGAIDHHYPLRQQMKSIHDRRAAQIVYHAHPGYHCGFDYEQDSSIGRGYATTLNRYRAAFTDSLRYGYVVAKYFEIPATGALLLADARVSGPLRQLGFIEYQHYLPVTATNLEERIRYVLDDANHAELDQIRRNGQQLVWQRHTTSDRARRINEVCSQL